MFYHQKRLFANCYRKTNQENLFSLILVGALLVKSMRGFGGKWEGFTAFLGVLLLGLQKASSKNDLTVWRGYKVWDFVKTYEFSLVKPCKFHNKREGGGGVKKPNFSVASFMDEAKRTVQAKEKIIKNLFVSIPRNFPNCN